MSSTTRLRVQVCATCCVLGAATAFLTFTNRGMLVLALAICVAAVLAVWLARTRPDVFLPLANGQANKRAQPVLKSIMTTQAAGSARTNTARTVERRLNIPLDQERPLD